MRSVVLVLLVALPCHTFIAPAPKSIHLHVRSSVGVGESRHHSFAVLHAEGKQGSSLVGETDTVVAQGNATGIAANPDAEAMGSPSLLQRFQSFRKNRWVRLVTFLGLWYAFNAGFNVSNKQVLNQFPYPWVVSWCQLATGLLFVIPAWTSGMRSKPIVDKSLLLKFLPIALLHSSGHASQVAAMGLGTVFFTHVIKAAEPLIGTLVVLAFTGKIAPWYVNICLAPVIGGVAYAAMKPGAGLDFSDLWSPPALLALASTVAFAIAKLLAKNLMNPELKKERKLDAANNYALLTCCSSAVLFLPSMLAEGAPALNALSNMGEQQLPFLKSLLTCGAFYYAYNEMGFRVLDLLGPVSQAVANSAKRVVILFAAVLFLGESVTQQKLIGSSIAIAGVTLYSLAKAIAAKRKKLRKEKKVVVEIVESVEQPGTWQP